MSSMEERPATKQIYSQKIPLERDSIVSATNTCLSLSPATEDLLPSLPIKLKYLHSDKKILPSRTFASSATKEILYKESV